MNLCECKNLNDYIQKKPDTFNYSDYCNIYYNSKTECFMDCRIIRTRRFTEIEEEKDNIVIMCPKHHPFFYYLAGIVHIQPFEIQNNIIHAWFHKKTFELKILLKKLIPDKIEQRINIGLLKAWYGYCGSKLCCISIYNEELGEFYSNYEDSYDDEDDCKCCVANDAWVIMLNLGHILWSLKF